MPTTPQQRHIRLAIKHGNEVIEDFKQHSTGKLNLWVSITDLSQKYNITVEAQGRINPGIITAIVGQLPFSEFKYQGLIDLLGSIPKEFVHSLTPDHGREFLGLNDIRERLGVAIYWPDPYSPEERGPNENTNG